MLKVSARSLAGAWYRYECTTLVWFLVYNQCRVHYWIIALCLPGLFQECQTYISCGSGWNPPQLGWWNREPGLPQSTCNSSTKKTFLDAQTMRKSIKVLTNRQWKFRRCPIGQRGKFSPTLWKCWKKATPFPAHPINRLGTPYFMAFWTVRIKTYSSTAVNAEKSFSRSFDPLGYQHLS